MNNELGDANFKNPSHIETAEELSRMRANIVLQIQGLRQSLADLSSNTHSLSLTVSENLKAQIMILETQEADLVAKIDLLKKPVTKSMQ